MRFFAGLAWPIPVSLLLAAMVTGACAPPSALSPPAEPEKSAEASADPLPLPLEALQPTAAQRSELAALLVTVERDIEPITSATKDFARAFANASRRCQPDSSFIAMEAEHTVRTAEQVRGKVLDAINRLHAILTPDQRRAFAQGLLGAQEDERRSRTSRDESRSRSVAEELDLSLGQIVRVLVRVGSLRSDFEERVGPWRKRYASAVAAFPDDDFDVRQHAIAEAPLAALMTRFARDAFRVLLPLLEPPQCAALARLIEEKLEE